MTDRAKDQPFDERAALGQLERFRTEIERYRKERQTVHQEFEHFVSSFPSPESVFPPETPEMIPAKHRYAETASNLPVPLPPVPPRPSAPPATVQPPPRPSIAAPPRTDAAIPTIKAPPPAAPPTEAGTQPPAPSSTFAALSDVEPTAPLADTPAPKRSGVPILILLVVLAAAAGLWIWNAQRVEPQQEVSGDAAPGQQPPVAAAPTAETTPPAPTTESVVTTVRRAWVRVIADGERVVERELAADTRLPFNAEKTIVIRTGDAGAVRLSIRGEDQGPLGRDGQVVTRTFTVPEKTPR